MRFLRDENSQILSRHVKIESAQCGVAQEVTVPRSLTNAKPTNPYPFHRIYNFTVFTHRDCLSTIKHQAFSTFAINFSPNQSITCIPLNSSIVQLFPQHIFSLLGLNALPRPRPLRIFAIYIPFNMSKLAAPKYIIY